MIFHVILNTELMRTLAETIEVELQELGTACAAASMACDGRAVRLIVARMTQLQAIQDEIQNALDRGVAEGKAQEQLAAYRIATAAKQNGTGN